MSSEKLAVMEDDKAKEEVENSPTVTNNFPWYCYLEEVIRVFLRCLGFENHESAKSGEEKEVAVDSNMSSEKEGENCQVNEPSAVQDSSSSSNSGGATSVPAAASTTDLDAADSPSTADPALGSPAISVEDAATTAARRPSRPPINNGSGPQTN